MGARRHTGEPESSSALTRVPESEPTRFTAARSRWSSIALGESRSGSARPLLRREWAARRERTGRSGRRGEPHRSPGAARPQQKSVRRLHHAAGSNPLMILPQVHLRKPCYDFYFL